MQEYPVTMKARLILPIDAEPEIGRDRLLNVKEIGWVDRFTLVHSLE